MIEVEVHCPVCEVCVVRVVGSEADEVRYCSPACARRAKKRRRSVSLLDPWLNALAQWEGIRDAKSQPRCLATGKIRYVSDAHAWVLICQRHPTVPTLQPYPCDACTAWHIGNSMAVSKGRRAQVMHQIEEAKRVRLAGSVATERQLAM